MKVLVTGGTGFIGKHLVRELTKRDYDVVCLVRKTSRTEILDAMGVRYLICDMTDPADVERAFDRVLPRAVAHCAAQVMGTDESELCRINVTTTRNVLNACSSYKIDRLVYLSSVSVISGNEETPLTEGLPYKASNAYGRSKIEAERLVVAYRDKGLKAAIIRPCMVYGEDEPHMLDSICEAVTKKRIPLFDVPGMDMRLQLIYISNLMQVLLAAMEKEEALTGTFMAADREVITIRKSLEILYDEIGKGDPFVIPSWVMRACMMIPFVERKIRKKFKDRVYDISRATDILGYDPKVSTEEGLRKVVKYWKMRRKKLA